MLIILAHRTSSIIMGAEIISDHSANGSMLTRNYLYSFEKKVKRDDTLDIPKRAVSARNHWHQKL